MYSPKNDILPHLKRPRGPQSIRQIWLGCWTVGRPGIHSVRMYLDELVKSGQLERDEKGRYAIKGKKR